MKKLIMFFVALMLFGELFAQVKPKHRASLGKNDIIVFLNKTNDIIKEAKKIVDEHKIYTGALLVAYNMQKQAIDSFKNGKIYTALNLSANARDFCYYSYVKNIQNDTPRDWHPGPKYKPFIKNTLTKVQITNMLKNMANPQAEVDIQTDSLEYLKPIYSTSKGKRRRTVF